MLDQEVVFWDDRECESFSTTDDEDWESEEELDDQHHLDQSGTSDTAAEEGSTSGASQSNTASNITSSTASSNSKGKRPAGDAANGSGCRNGRQKRLKTVIGGEDDLGESPRRLACPFFKRFSPRAPKAASCYFPGFNGVSRVKEHIYREHRIINRCGRCFQSFTNGAAFNAHLRAEERCIRLEDDPEIQVITADQETLLKCKKRAKAPKSEEERWKCVYRILFPQDDEKSMPSPYCVYDSNVLSRIKRDQS
ncbi:hypothetical protein SLS55_000265 [Diplodia seriata]|uniref:C2H2-type domain-containing protein n=1 Tax=Diplodia seriata TaxID=420778 RepID=A0ABR3CTU3_9PEZI